MSFVINPYTFSFEPTGLFNLGLWLDASDSGTLFNGSTSFGPVSPAILPNDPVGYWGDKSGNGRHFVSTTTAPSRRPLLKIATQNGKNTVFFDGVNDVLTSNAFMYNAGAVTIFVASKSYSLGGIKRCVIGEFYATTDRYYPIYSNDGVPQQLTSFASVGGTQLLSPTISYGTAFNQGVFNIITAVDSGSSYTGFVNGANGGTTSYTRPASSSFGLVGLGSQITGTGAPSGPMESNICEVIVYTRALTTQERQLVENYLASKWAI